MKQITAIFFFLFCGFGLVAQTEIDVLILNRNYNEALIEIGKHLEQSPDAELWFKQGLVYEKLMNYDAAIASLTKACEMEPATTAYWEELADAHTALGNYQNATDYLQQALSIDSTDARLKGKLALSYINLKAYLEAFRCYEQICSADSANTFYKRYYAYSAYRTGKDSLAIQLYEQLAAAGSRDLTTWTNLATIYAVKEKQNEAIVTCERGLGVFPDNGTLLLKKADVCFQFKQYGKALQAYESYLADNDSTYDVLKNYGICLYFEKEEEQALKILDKCYMQTPNDPVVDFYMGASYKKLKQFTESAGFLELAIEVATPPYLAEIYHHLGQVYAATRDFEKSIAAYKKAMELDSEKKELLFEIATTYEEFNSDKTVALFYYQEYLKALGDQAANASYALDRITKIKEELFFNSAQDSAIN